MILLALIPPVLVHPLGYCAGTAQQVVACRSYNLYSGVGADLSELSIVIALITGLLAWWHHHNCHVKGCWWTSFHPHELHGHPVCRKHYHEEGSDHVISGATATAPGPSGTTSAAPPP